MVIGGSRADHPDVRLGRGVGGDVPETAAILPVRVPAPAPPRTDRRCALGDTARPSAARQRRTSGPWTRPKASSKPVRSVRPASRTNSRWRSMMASKWAQRRSPGTARASRTRRNRWLLAALARSPPVSGTSTYLGSQSAKSLIGYAEVTSRVTDTAILQQLRSEIYLDSSTCLSCAV